MSDLTMHCWKATKKDTAVLDALRESYENSSEDWNESMCVRAGLRLLARKRGLRALAREKGVVVDE